MFDIKIQLLEGFQYEGESSFTWDPDKFNHTPDGGVNMYKLGPNHELKPQEVIKEYHFFPVHIIKHFYAKEREITIIENKSIIQN